MKTNRETTQRTKDRDGENRRVEGRSVECGCLLIGGDLVAVSCLISFEMSETQISNSNTS